MRDGAEAEVDLEGVVADDLLVLAPGAQVVVDGEVVRAGGLELNESLLTGESDPVHKHPGDEVMSGSFVAAGSGACRATKVGAESYAASLAGEARRFTLVALRAADGDQPDPAVPDDRPAPARRWCCCGGCCDTSDDWQDALVGNGRGLRWPWCPTAWCC